MRSHGRALLDSRGTRSRGRAHQIMRSPGVRASLGACISVVCTSLDRARRWGDMHSRALLGTRTPDNAQPWRVHTTGARHEECAFQVVRASLGRVSLGRRALQFTHTSLGASIPGSACAPGCTHIPRARSCACAHAPRCPDARFSVHAPKHAPGRTHMAF